MVEAPQQQCAFESTHIDARANLTEMSLQNKRNSSDFRGHREQGACKSITNSTSHMAQRVTRPVTCAGRPGTDGAALTSPDLPHARG